jgi:hypothetical protein
MTGANPPLPDPRFWTRYSSNQELPISGLASVALHLMAALLFGLLFTFVIGRDHSPEMPVEAYNLDGDPDAGGGGDPNASAISDVSGNRLIERAGADEIAPDAPRPNVTIGAVPDIDILPDLPDDPKSDRVFHEADAARKDAQAVEGKKGGRPSGPPPSAGKGGPGAGGGQGGGVGPGTGAGTRPGSAGSVRAKRNLRWTLQFSSLDGRDYLRQLALLGADLVAEYADGAQVMYRQLDRRPVPAEPVDPRVRDRLRWADGRPNSVGELAAAMGLERQPLAIRAYFPYGLEQELLKLELAYRGRKEEDIHSTTFRVLLTGSGYRLAVAEQQYNP